VLAEQAQHVFVVDNDSHDDSLAQLSASISDRCVTLIRNGQNVGFAAACNMGARASAASTVLFLNPDSVLAEGSLRRMLDVLESDPSIGMVGGLLCNPDGSEQPGGRRVFPTPRRAFMRAFGLSRLGKWFPSLFSDFLLHKEPLPLAPTPVEAISGACMLVKREAIEDVGLLDEGYFLHCEDLDWCMRFRLKNWRVVFVLDARVVHARGACSRNRPFFVEWHKHRGMLRFYNKFFREQYPGPLWWLVVLGVWLRFGLVSAYFAARLLLEKVKDALKGGVRA
jgi:GT2 family glycosyltransferase